MILRTAGRKACQEEAAPGASLTKGNMHKERKKTRLHSTNVRFGWDPLKGNSWIQIHPLNVVCFYPVMFMLNLFPFRFVFFFHLKSYGLFLYSNNSSSINRESDIFHIQGSCSTHCLRTTSLWLIHIFWTILMRILI